MSPGMAMSGQIGKESPEIYEKGVKHMFDNGIKHVPRKYILPSSERPNAVTEITATSNLELPIIDFAELQGPNRARVLDSLTHACENFGFFQLVNHGMDEEMIKRMVEVSKSFFEMPLCEREKYMSADMNSPVRYGTSFNQTKDGVFCWRDFLKLICTPLDDDHHLSNWPSSPQHFRELAVGYAKETRGLFVMVVGAILESLGLAGINDDEILKELVEDGSQLMVVNCYPPCPQPDLTLGMPPHSDYGFLTLLLQDDVAGLQILHHHNWVTVQPIPGSFVVNIGDHLEIYSNGRYKSVLHRVLVNTMKNRISVASLHSLPFTSTVRPAAMLVTETNPRRYKDTDFATFLNYIKSCDSTKMNFLESRKILY